MADALAAASEKPLPPVSALMRMITKWEAGTRNPRECYVLLYHRVFPGLGRVPPPAGIAVFGGPGQPAEPPRLVPDGLAGIPAPAEVIAEADTLIAGGADPARIWALREAYLDKWRAARDMAALIAALKDDTSGDGDVRAG